MFHLEAARFYIDGERYNSGYGLSLTTEYLPEALMIFSVFQRYRENYAIRIKDTDTGEVLKSHGPSIEAAHLTLRRAYSARLMAPATTYIKQFHELNNLVEP